MSERNCYKKFGERLKLCRELFGLNQSELAKRVGLSRPAVTNIECGRQGVTLEMVIKFATAFRVKPERLIRGIWKP